MYFLYMTPSLSGVRVSPRTEGSVEHLTLLFLTCLIWNGDKSMRKASKCGPHRWPHASAVVIIHHEGNRYQLNATICCDIFYDKIAQPLYVVSPRANIHYTLGNFTVGMKTCISKHVGLVLRISGCCSIVGVGRKKTTTSKYFPGSPLKACHWGGLSIWLNKF